MKDFLRPTEQKIKYTILLLLIFPIPIFYWFVVPLFAVLLVLVFQLFQALLESRLEIDRMEFLFSGAVFLIIATLCAYVAACTAVFLSQKSNSIKVAVKALFVIAIALWIGSAIFFYIVPMLKIQGFIN